MVLHFLKEKITNAEFIREPTDFCELLGTYPMLLHEQYLSELKKRLLTEVFDDVTSEAVADENACLFSFNRNDEPALLEIAVTHLGVKDSTVSWRYADCRKNAVAEFCYRAGLNEVYLFCAVGGKRSVLHLLEVNGNLFAIPVVFDDDFEAYRSFAETECAKFGYGYLRDYLPREHGDLLSKGRHRVTHEEPVSFTGNSGLDNGDTL